GGANCPVEGRRVENLRDPARVFAKALAGAWLAQAAWLEAGSVHAFARLADELVAHGAPAALVRRAHAAAADEIRHAAIVGSLAAHYGGHPPPAALAQPVARSLEALASENAGGGLVR